MFGCFDTICFHQWLDETSLMTIDRARHQSMGIAEYCQAFITLTFFSFQVISGSVLGLLAIQPLGPGTPAMSWVGSRSWHGAQAGPVISQPLLQSLCPLYPRISCRQNRLQFTAGLVSQSLHLKACLATEDGLSLTLKYPDGILAESKWERTEEDRKK